MRNHIALRAIIQRQRFLAPVIIDVSVGVLLLACWFTVSVELAHVLTGIALIGVIIGHLVLRRTRIRRWRRLPRRNFARAIGSRAGYMVLVIAGGAMVVSGLLRLASVPPNYAWHATCGYMLLMFVCIHLWWVRRPLGTRILVALKRSLSCRRPLPLWLGVLALMPNMLLRPSSNGMASVFF